MARQFGKITIRADGLDGKKAYEYERTVADMLNALDATQTGHAVLNGIRFYQREVLIYPYDGKHGRCNASAYGERWGLFRTKVSFTPSMWFANSPCSVRMRPYGGNAPHEALVHELTHAVRSVAGTLDSFTPIEEEEIAILVTNIFSSETNRRLRTSYDFLTVALPQWGWRNRHGKDVYSQSDYSTDYLKKHRPLIEKFYKQHKDFSRWLARVKAPFNPLREYYSQDVSRARLAGIPHREGK
jgi:hypothetical protein